MAWSASAAVAASADSKWRKAYHPRAFWFGFRFTPLRPPLSGPYRAKKASISGSVMFCGRFLTKMEQGSFPEPSSSAAGEVAEAVAVAVAVAPWGG